MKTGPFFSAVAASILASSATAQSESAVVPKPAVASPGGRASDQSTPPPSVNQSIAPTLSAGQQSELDEIVAWEKTYYRSPDPTRFFNAIRRKAELGALASPDQGWTTAAFIAEILKDTPAATETIAGEMSALAEPARQWWWTGVWMAKTPEAKALLATFAARPEGDPARIGYPWLQQQPPEILKREIRGSQQLAMLWAAFFASGDDVFLAKMFEAIPHPDFSSSELSEKARQRRTKATAAARFQLASAARGDTELMERLQTLAERAPAAQRTALLAVLDGGEPPEAEHADNAGPAAVETPPAESPAPK